MNDSSSFGWISRYSGLVISAVTALAFNRASKYLEVTRATQPPSTKNNEYLSWKWRNFLISFFHSTITGLGTIYCFFDEPQLISDMIDAQSNAAYLLACFSNGYFLYDLSEMCLKFGYKGAGELVCHHLLVLACLFISIWQHRFLGYAVTALVVELNNIFLHFRQLLNIAKVSKRSFLYRLNSWINICSFLVFRMFTLVWLGKCLYGHRLVVPIVPYCTAVICLAVVSVMTTVLFYRLINSDFFAPKPQTSAVAITDIVSEASPRRSVTSSLSNGHSAHSPDETSKTSSESNGNLNNPVYEFPSKETTNKIN